MTAKTALAPLDATSNPFSRDQESIYANVQTHYGSAASNNKDEGYGHAVASAFGYSKEELTNAPAESNLGLSCGNPFAIAKIREGETVIDLGSGAGFDVFQAAKKVGPSGRAIGVDMNEDMLTRAGNIKEKVKADNASFVKSPITQIDVPDCTANCIVSNCVINLVPESEKQLVFNEMFRLLKPNGRVAVSDILLKQELPDELKNDVALYVGCIAGASRIEQYEKYLREANFNDILLVPEQSDLNIYKTASKEGSGLGCCGPKSSGVSSCSNQANSTKKHDLEDIDLNIWAASYKIYAVKLKG